MVVASLSSSAPPPPLSSSLSSFPRGKDAPFPYDPPYQQQLDLMDVLLESLERAWQERHDDDDEEDESTKQNPGKDEEGGSSLSPNQNSNNKKNKKNNRAKIMMLESPTGTGKSLSLAAASLTWLRHVEQLDLYSSTKDAAAVAAVPTPPGGPLSSSPSSSGGVSSSSSSWLSTWVSPDDRAAADTATRAKQQAQQTRAALGRELDRIRSQIQIGKDRGSVSSENHHDRQRQQRRLDVARQAVALARQRQQEVAVVPHRVRKRTKQVRLDTVSSSKSTSHGNDDDDDEFCLEDYQSDHNNDENDDISGWKNQHQPNRLSLYDDDMKEKTASSHGPVSTTLSTSQLLDGSYLDGSIVHYNNNGMTTQQKQQAKNRTTVASGGGGRSNDDNSIMRTGSGVRKIIYAARTHSQLSQFVGEVRRIDPTVRLVHLGARQVLCGNVQVNHHPSQRQPGPTLSERAISEACLDLQKGKTTGKTTTTRRNKSAVGVVETRTKKRATQQQQEQNDNEAAGTTTTSTTGTTGCPLLAGREAALSTLALHVQVQPTDIEELAALGRATHTCAYYASRTAVAAAEMIVLPYALLLASAATRHRTLGLDLTGALVLIDEAHNLPEAIRNLHSTRLSLTVLQAAAAQLSAYATKYAQRLAGRNLFYLGQLLKIVLALIKQLQSSSTSKFKPPGGGGSCVGAAATVADASTLMMTSTELLIRCRLDHINLFQILRYLERSRLAQKLLGFMNYQQQHHGHPTSYHGTGSSHIDGPPAFEEELLSKHVSPMAVVEAFLEKLSLSGTDGKVVVDRHSSSCPVVTGGAVAASSSSSGPGFRYVLLNPATCMVDLVQEAHAIALVGGTLRPFLHVAAELFVNDKDDPDLMAAARQADECIKSSLTSSSLRRVFTPTTYPSSFASITDHLTVFSCGHVVPPSNVLLQRWSHGPTGRTLDLRHQSRTTETMLDEVGRCVIEICRVCPAGVVIFFPSYSYEQLVFARLQRSGLLQQLESLKPLHREPAKSHQVEASLKRYANDAVRRKGAVLFSVIGGKLSEGINFKDSMARCVAVVGLPYPDITDPVLQEKMSLLDSMSAISGRDYYQNLCIRAVNQSVGRAIRHANDFAAIVLLDQRYNTNLGIKEALPQWLTNGSLPQSRDFRQHMNDMARFFDTIQPSPDDTR